MLKKWFEKNLIYLKSTLNFVFHFILMNLRGGIYLLAQSFIRSRNANFLLCCFGFMTQSIDDAKKSGESQEMVARKTGKKIADSNHHICWFGKGNFLEEKVWSLIRLLSRNCGWICDEVFISCHVYIFPTRGLAFLTLFCILPFYVIAENSLQKRWFS